MSQHERNLELEQALLDLDEAHALIRSMAEAIANRDAARETEKRLKQQLRSATYQRKVAEEKYDTLVMTVRRLGRVDGA